MRISEINWENQYEILESEELEKIYREYLSKGFSYKSFNHLFNIGPFIRTPSRRELAPGTMQQILGSRLIFGNELQLETLAAAEFIKINYSMDSIDKSFIIFPVSSP